MSDTKKKVKEVKEVKQAFREAQTNLKELRKQLGRDMPEIDALQANLVALRGFVFPGEEPPSGPLPEGFPALGFLRTAGIGTYNQLNAELEAHGGSLMHLREMTPEQESAIKLALE